MTHHMTNERLAELREAAAEDRLRPCGQPLYEFRDVIVSDDDVRGLLAMLDQERAKAISECLKAVEAVEDKADEWEWAIDAIRDRPSDLEDGKP